MWPPHIAFSVANSLSGQAPKRKLFISHRITKLVISYLGSCGNLDFFFPFIFQVINVYLELSK